MGEAVFMMLIFIGCFVVALCIAWLIWVLATFVSVRSGK